MYYRYKVNKKNHRWLKTTVLIIVISTVAFLGNKYQQYIFFWKYSNTKLKSKVETALMITEKYKRRVNLRDISRTVNEYITNDLLNTDLVILSAQLYFYIAETYMPGSFSELIINDKITSVSDTSHLHYLQSIRMMKKARAQLDGELMADEDIVMLAKALYLTRYSGPHDILQEVKKIQDIKSLKLKDDIRFCSIVYIENGMIEQGLALLNESGGVDDTVADTLFLASAEKIAKKYTNAILNYRKTLEKTIDENIKRLVHINLGKVFFQQSLYKEALNNFKLAEEIKGEDNALTMWIGKCFYAMGYRTKAKNMWTVILENDSGNNEVKKLLGIR